MQDSGKLIPGLQEIAVSDGLVTVNVSRHPAMRCREG
jgi:hypothetical protein